MCAVLGAAQVVAQKDRHLIKQTNDETVESLQEKIKTLQSQLTAEHNTTQQLQAALSDALD